MDGALAAFALATICLTVVVLICICIVKQIKVEFHVISPSQEDNEVPGREIVSDEEAEGVEIEEDRWLSASGKLHNSLCRWYKEGDGDIWDGETPYENCKTCGGDTPIVRRWNIDDE